MSSPATLSSSHAPGQMLEMAGVLQSLELADLSPEGAPNNDNVQISFDTEANTVTITATLPIVATTTADGVIYKANDYLP